MQLVVQPGKPVTGISNRQAGNVGDIALVDLDGQRLRLQAFAIAGIAGMVGTEFLQFLANPDESVSR